MEALAFGSYPTMRAYEFAGRSTNAPAITKKNLSSVSRHFIPNALLVIRRIDQYTNQLIKLLRSMVKINKYSIRKSSIFFANIFLVALGSGLVFAVGFLCQFFITSIFSGCCELESILLENANQPLYFIKFFSSSLGSALFPGLIFALLISFHQNKSWWVGALYGVLSLSAYDIALYLTHKDLNLLLSIFFNIIGGPAGGIISAYWARVVFINYSSRNLFGFGNLIANLFLFFLTLSCVFLAVFFFFLYPIPQPVRMNFVASQDFSIALKKQKITEELSYKKGSDLEKFSDHFPFLKEFDVSADVNAFTIFNYGGDIGALSLSFITDKKVTAKIVGIRGCSSIEEAVLFAKKYPKKYQEIDVQDIKFLSLGSRLRFFQKPQGKVTLYLPYEKPVSRRIDGKKLEIFTWSPLVASIPLQAENYIYFTGGPDFTKTMDKHIFPEKASDFERVKIEVGKKVFTVPIVSDNLGKCEVLDLQERGLDTADTLNKICLNSGFLIQVDAHGVGEFDALKVNIPNASWTTIDDKVDGLLTKRDENIDVISFSADRIKGNLRVGRRDIDVDNESVRIKGSDLSIHKEKDKSILSGTAQIVLINEKLLTKSIFFLLDATFQVLVLSTVAGFLGYLLRRFKAVLPKFFREIFVGNQMPIKMIP